MKQFLYLLAGLLFFASCNKQKNKDDIHTYKASTKITAKLSGDVVFAGNSTYNYYDIAITDDYYAFLDYYSDTILQVRKKSDFSLHQIGPEREIHSLRPIPPLPNMIMSIIKTGFLSGIMSRIC